MAAKKSAPKVTAVVVDEPVDEIVDEIAEPEIVDSPGEWEPIGHVRDRIQVLIARRGPNGGFRNAVEAFLNGKPVPSSDDEWQAFADSLER
jgi:hypothetical protein